MPHRAKNLPVSGPLGLLFLFLLLLTPAAFAQNAADGSNPDGSVAGDRPQTGRILLVLPFDNQSGQPGLDWIREAAPEVLDSRFRSAGFLPLTRADRLYALDRLGLPGSFQPSRATTLRIAQTLDADTVVIGNYTVTGEGSAASLKIEARLVDVARLRMSNPITVTGPTSELIPLFSRLSWILTRQLEPTFPVAEETFSTAGSTFRLDAFEQYVRGLTAPDAAERLEHLKQATTLEPDFWEAWLATGRVYFAMQQYEQAAPAFGHAATAGRDRLEAGFYRGLALLYIGQYPQAEQAFAEVARILPLPEVLNNQGVSLARRGKDGTVFFQQATTTDPRDADYHYNLALGLKHNGKHAEAQTELDTALKLRPNDSEIASLDAAWKNGTTTTTAPIERIKRTYDEAAFRQAALMLDAVESAHMATLPPADRARAAAKKGKDYLDRGLLLEAEREYQDALAADDHSFEAHAGLAEVRERSGNAKSAATEAQRSIALHPNVPAYLVLARVSLAQGHLPEAKNANSAALAIEPGNKTAQALEAVIAQRSK